MLPHQSHIKMKKLITLFAFSIILLIINSCNNNDQVIVDIKPGFEKYISGFTSGDQLSRSTKFAIRFTHDVNDSITKGQIADDEAFDFSPNIAGKAYWVDKRNLEFVPSELLESGKVYTVNFDLSKFIEVPAEYSLLEYQVKTIEQSFRFIDLGISTYELDMQWLKYDGEIMVADIADAESIEKMLEVKLLNKQAKIIWKHTEGSNIHHFSIDSIQRQEESEDLVLNYNGDAIGVDFSDQFIQRIPGLNAFEVINSQVFPDKNPYVVLSFSDPLKPDQKLQGLIYFSSDPHPDFIIERNKVKVFPSKELHGEQRLHISAGIENAMAYKLTNEVILPVSFESNNPAIQLVSSGVIMPTSKGLIFPFKAVSLNMVDLKIIQIYENNVLSFLQDNDISYSSNINRAGRLIFQKRLQLDQMIQADLNQWNTFKVDISKLIKVEAGAIYRVEIDFRQAYSIYPCDSSQTEIISEDEYKQEVLQNMKQYDRNSYYYDDYYYDDEYEEYNWREREDPCSNSYYHNNSIGQNLFASNLGITAKGSPTNKFAVVVSNLKTTDPMKDVNIKFYNLQKQLILESKTNSLGIVMEQLSSKPYFVVASIGDERGYLKLDNGEALSLSNFNVAGMIVQDGLKAFIYGERDVWRPGDTIYLTLIIEDIENKLPADHPVVFDLINPMGQRIVHQVKKNGENGFYSFPVSTDPNAVTGNWTASFKVGGAQFSRRIRIETIKPNRMKAKMDFNSDLLTDDRLNSPINIEANWLHGAPAKDAQVKILMNLKPTNTTFKKFEQYQFQYPNSNFEVEESEVYNGKVDENGKTKFNLKISAQNAPGMINAQFVTRVFEKSGDFSIITQSVKYSPYDSYVGLKMQTNGESGWYTTDKDYKVDLVTVDQFGKPISQSNVKVKIYKLGWRWWWNSYGDNLASYLGSTTQSPVSTEYVNTDEKGLGTFEMSVKYKSYDDNGRYLIVAEDPQSGHKTGKIVYFSKWYGRLGGGSVGANILSFSSDKDKYKVGEDIQINIPSSKNGRAMISLESGSNILDVFWVETTNDETQFSFKATSAMAPNVFVHISLLQPHAQTINDNPIRMYGIIPIEVEDPATVLKPKIQMATTLKPEQKFQVKVSEETGRAMTYTIAIVDEGLLDITNFKTPNPWSRFYAKEALGIRTWDMYDDVIGAYGARLEKAFAIGGDESAPDPSKNKANRFKPVVFYEGPFVLNSNETKTHTFTMPNYIGSVRVMVIAGNKGAYGRAEKAVAVKKNLMLLATLPRVLGPKEEVVLPVTVFSMDGKIKEVNLKLSTNNMVQIIGSATQKMAFAKEGEQIAYFKLKVNEKTGKATAHIEATSGSLKAQYDIELDIRTPNIQNIRIQDTLLSAGSEWLVDTKPFGIIGTNSAIVEISGIPAMGLNYRLQELLGYPHGCIEQTTSKMFPQLFLGDFIDLNSYDKEQMERNIMGGLNQLRGFQLPNGGFSYWPGSSYADNWGTSYAGHMMLMAEKKGYQLPSRMKSQWISFQRSVANSWSDHQFYGDQLNQAYRLYTLALAGQSELGAMNRLSKLASLNERTRYMLALAYAEMGQALMARTLISKISIDNGSKPSYLNDYTYGSELRDEAIRLQLYSKLGDKEKSFYFVKRISKTLDSRQWVSTQSMAYSLLAISEFYAGQKPESIKFSLNWNGKTENIDARSFVFKRDLVLSSMATKPLKIKNQSTGALYVRLIMKGIPVEGDEQNTSNNLNMDVIYQDMEGKSLDPLKIEQGTDFKAIVNISNPGSLGNYSHLALTQIFPSGWEIINTRLLGLNDESSPSNYVDIRDDRVNTYFSINKYKRLTYVVILNAAYEGKFYKPAINCSAMYDNSIQSIIKGAWVEVVKP